MITGIKKKLIKFVLFVCNALLAVVGLAVFVVTLLVRYQDGVRAFAAQKLGEQLGQLQTDMTVLAVVGFMMFIVGASALIGVGLENLIALRLFVVLIILIGLTQLGYAIGVACTKGKIKSRVYRDITVYTINYDLQSDEMRSAFDGMQVKGNCCGCYGRRDYRKLRYPVPGSCPASTEKGCCRVIWDNLKILGTAFGFIALTVAVVENLAVILACLLVKSIEDARYDVKAASKKKSGKKSDPQLLCYREMITE